MRAKSAFCLVELRPLDHDLAVMREGKKMCIKFKPFSRRIFELCEKPDMVVEKLRSVDPKVDMLNPPNMAMTMIERRMWGAEVPVYRMKTELPSDTVILRFTGSEPCKDHDSCEKTVQDLQTLQIEKHHQADIMWSFLIGGDAFVYEGTGWRHTTNKEDAYVQYDFRNVDIAYIGKDNNDVTPDMRWACRKLIEHSCRLEFLTVKPLFVGDRTAIDTLYTL